LIIGLSKVSLLSLIEDNKQLRIKTQISQHELWDECQTFKESNPVGYEKMLDFTEDLIEQFKDFTEPIKFIMRGLPFAHFNMAYKIEYGVNSESDYGVGWLIGIVLYPAGFKLRYLDMLHDRDEYIEEIRQKLLKFQEKRKGEQNGL
jgi:hypothetical protein